jgi:NAD(P)-dependent dehydrogenase (short-subunit alcohol dehydrogenase family)
MGRVEGKRAIVTGAGSGIGRGAAVLLAREGARVGLVDVDEAAARGTAELIDGEALVLAADVSDEEQVRRAVREAVGAWGGLDVVVANAAVQLFGRDARVHELELAAWERTLAANLTGAFLTCKHGVAALLESGGGSVILTGSPTGLFGLGPRFTAYSSSKAGVHGLARVMAVDYAGDGIRVNIVVPGFTNTPLVTRIVENDDERENLLRMIPLGRPGTPEDVAAMILFLASDESAYATGGFYSIDGGITAV